MERGNWPQEVPEIRRPMDGRKSTRVLVRFLAFELRPKPQREPLSPVTEVGIRVRFPQTPEAKTNNKVRAWMPPTASVISWSCHIRHRALQSYPTKRPQAGSLLSPRRPPSRALTAAEHATAPDRRAEGGSSGTNGSLALTCPCAFSFQEGKTIWIHSVKIHWNI